MDRATLAKNLVRLRASKDLTQEEAARRAQLSRKAYRDLEGGLASPRAATVQALADAFGVPLRELLLPVPKLDSVRFRSLKRMKGRDAVLYDIGRWLSEFRDLERTLGVQPASRLAELRQLALAERANGLSNVAAAVRRALRLEVREPVHDICGLLESLGVKVRSVEVQTDAFYGLSVAEADGGPAIVVNAWNRLPVEQWIHSAAHELGHLLLHLGDYDVTETEESDAEEAEADQFASHFLMPEGPFRSEWEAARGLPLVRRIFKVKRIFRVSWRSVVYRAAEHLPADQRNAFWMRVQIELKRTLGRSLTKHDEPLPLEGSWFRGVGSEPLPMSEVDFQSDRLAALVRRGIEEGVISLGRGAEILGVSAAEMRAWAASWAA
jgi:Zn-dependent peptidase ImmA (M78 family)/DNA-binding XRE family transcriptional regulator